MLDSFCDIVGGFLMGAILMGIFAFGIVPLIERKQREKEEIERLANESLKEKIKRGEI